MAATFVDPEHARSGVGREIVDHLLSVAREEGYETVTVHASLNAVGFYEVAGFEHVREIDIAGPAGAGVDVPAVLMRTTLS
ncbi:GNAT family N-acetyltransferase [Natronobacterium lacisalsi]|uniref:GNAT family N-acetyltransferase n=1 Tax=Natronobacterium lacisalsi TaxID=229731 RepID=UPI000A2F4E2B|nr:GNAT family N-acetyltransferase [Halobiforma lacisalsi]